MRRQHCRIGFQRAISLVLITFVIVSQVSEVRAGQGGTSPASSATPSKLNIIIIGGDGPINNVKLRVAREAIVQVNDENNRPIGGVAVAFLLPSSGPGGLFSNGANVLNVTTNSAGRASAQFVPNSLNGAFQINVGASFQGQVSTAIIPQTNALPVASAAADEAAGGVSTGTGISATTVAIIVAAVAGAVAVGVAASGKGNDKPAETASTPTIRIGGGGPPTVGTPGFQQADRTAKPAPKWR
jgi:hypothetical protein